MFTVRRMYLLFIFSVIMLLSSFFTADPLQAEVQQAVNIPWSGYWWPSRYGGLATGSDYRGHPAPLEKYEMLTQGTFDNSQLIAWYDDYYYDPYAQSWNGLCPEWSRAAMWESYDILPTSEDNIVFRVGDKKGLLVMCHGADDKISEHVDDPVNFHYWLLHYIKDQQTAFTANLGTADQVWYYPVYRYDMTDVKVGVTESVRVTISFADDGVSPDYMGTKEIQRTYTYTLTSNTQGEVISGQWTGNSVNDHPWNLIMPLSAVSKSPYIDSDEVRRIAQSKRNFIDNEDNSPAFITPGTYHLALLRESRYVVDGRPGEEIYVKALKEDGSNETMNVEITDDAGGVMTQQSLVLKNDSMAFRIVIQHPPYTISLTQDKYGDPNIYSLSVDTQKAYRQRVPYIPKNGMWSGFALTNSGDKPAEDVMLVSYTDNGDPLQTVLGPLTLNPKEKKTFLYDDLNWRKHEYAETDSLALVSNQPVQMINLYGLSPGPMGGFVQGEAIGSHLVVPDTLAPSQTQSMQGGVFNETFFDAPVTFQIYSADGTLQKEFSDVIPAGNKYTISPGTSPFNKISNGGWIDILSTGTISGYQYVKVKMSSKKLNVLDSLFATPVETTEKIVPHITSPEGYWETNLTVINPNDSANNVVLHLRRAGIDHSGDQNIEFAPHEKQTFNLTQQFGKLPDDALFHSILDIVGQYPIAGYYTFSPSNGGDAASYPLMDVSFFKPELVLPHNPGNAYWWTGIDLCNPNGFPVEVEIAPYDDSKDLMADHVVRINLEAGAYDVFLLGDLFKDVQSDISFITFQTKGVMPAPIGGFYLYGNMNNGQESVETLSGANM